MTKKIFVIYSKGSDGEPAGVTTTRAAALEWMYDNKTNHAEYAFKEFEIGGHGKPRKPKLNP